MFEITDYRCQHHPNPHPEERAARLEEWERAPCLLPILLGVLSAGAQKRLDAPLRGAPQDEGVVVTGDPARTVATTPPAPGE